MSSIFINPYQFSSDIVMSGGMEYSPGDGYKYHRFTASDTLTVTSGGAVEALVVAGGGGGGGRASGGSGAEPTGGGGAGGVITGSYNVTSNASITIGAGGGSNTNGGSTIFGSHATATGGGKGAGEWNQAASSGGSGGGASYHPASTAGTGTAGQGNNGALGGSSRGGGGGGKGSAGASGASGGSGGSGLEWPTGSGNYYGGGGGAGRATAASGDSPGGSSIGGTGTNGTGGAAVINTGSGGGGSCNNGTGPSIGGAGASGVVIIRYPYTGSNMWSDNFNDNSIDAPWVNPAWSTTALSVSSGVVTSLTNGAEQDIYLNQDLGSVNHWAEIDVVAQPGNANVGVLTRCDPAFRTHYLARYYSAVGGWNLIRMVNGSATSLISSATNAPSTPFRMRLETETVAGNVELRLYQVTAGVKTLRLSYTDSSGSKLTTGVRCGLRPVGEPGNAAQCDNFSTGPL